MDDDTLKEIRAIRKVLYAMAAHMGIEMPKKKDDASVVSVTTLPGGRVEVNESSGGVLPRQLIPAEERAMQENTKTPRGLGNGGGDGVTVDEDTLQHFRVIKDRRAT